MLNPGHNGGNAANPAAINRQVPAGFGQYKACDTTGTETNDGYLNDIRGRHVGTAEVRHAIESAQGGAVVEGAVGAGAGTVAFGFKGGIGTASRKTAGYTVGVLVQSNFGGTLRMNGAPVGRELRESGPNSGRGSIIMVVATDAPVDARNLRRMAARTMFGLARTGSDGSNGSAARKSDAENGPLLMWPCALSVRLYQRSRLAAAACEGILS